MCTDERQDPHCLSAYFRNITAMHKTQGWCLGSSWVPTVSSAAVERELRGAARVNGRSAEPSGGF